MANKTTYSKMVNVWKSDSGDIYLSPYNNIGCVEYVSPFTVKLPDVLNDKTEDEILDFITCNGTMHEDYTFVFEL